MNKISDKKVEVHDLTFMLLSIIDRLGLRFTAREFRATLAVLLQQTKKVTIKQLENPPGTLFIFKDFGIVL